MRRMTTNGKEVIYCLDRFYETNDYEWVQRLVSYDCRCKDDWRAQLGTLSPVSRWARVSMAYELIGRELLGEDWWKQHGEQVLQEMHQDETEHATS